MRCVEEQDYCYQKFGCLQKFFFLLTGISCLYRHARMGLAYYSFIWLSVCFPPLKSYLVSKHIVDCEKGLF